MASRVHIWSTGSRRDSRRSRIAAAVSSAFFALALSLAACGPQLEPQHQEEEAQALEQIVTLAPSITETAFALGLGDRILGVGDYDRYPPETDAKERLGGLFDPNFERIVSLEPDLVILLPSQQELAGRLAKLDIPSLIVASDTVEDVEQTVLQIAERCGVPEQGQSLAADLAKRLEPAPELGRGARVLILLSRPPGSLGRLFSAGPSTFYDQLLSRLGAENALAGSVAAYPEVGLDTILDIAPTHIIELQTEELTADEQEELLADWWGESKVSGIGGLSPSALQRIPAVARKQIFVIGGDFTLTPGPRLPRLYDELKRALANPGTSDG